MYTYIRDHVPLVIGAIVGDLTDADLDAMEQHGRWIVERGRPYLSIYLAQRATHPNSSQRRRMADLGKLGASRFCLGNAVILDNALAAGALRAIRWLRPAEHPEKAMTSAQEGLAWLQSVASERGLVLPLAGVEHALQLEALVLAGRDGDPRALSA